MSKQLDGKVALLTGGARGMGAAHARAIVAAGGKVVVGDILDEEGQQLVDELGSENARYIHLDVTSEEDWEAAVAATLEAFGKLNVLINNAGFGNTGLLGSYHRKQWDKAILVNLTSAFIGITAALDALKSSAPSSVINVASSLAMRGQGGMHGYVASKWGLRGFTKSAAIELAADGIRVNSVHPGVIKTPIIASTDFGSHNLGPMGRAAEPEEVSPLVVFLASDASSFSTGAEFLVDGGSTAGISAVPALNK